MASKSGAPFAYWGSKVRMAPWIIERLPPHDHYIEACAGSAAVLAAKPPAMAETVNDVYSEVVNFFRVLRDPDLCAELVDLVRFTPYAREVTWDAHQIGPDATPIERAWAFFIRQQMAVIPGRTGWSYGVNAVSAASANQPGRWASMPEHLQRCHARFRKVQVENCDVLELIDRYDDPTVLFFIDPPYTEDTRPNSTGAASGYVEDNFDHQALLGALSDCQASVAVTHYPTGLYDDAGLWTSTEDFVSHRNLPNTATANGRDERVERLYVINRSGREADQRLF